MIRRAVREWQTSCRVEDELSGVACELFRSGRRVIEWNVSGLEVADKLFEEWKASCPGVVDKLSGSGSRVVMEWHESGPGVVG